MSKKLTLDQFNAHLKIIAERFSIKDLNIHYNFNTDYQLVNVTRTVIDAVNNPEQQDNFLENLHAIGCRTILNHQSSWVHPLLGDYDSFPFNEVAFSNIAHIARDNKYSAMNSLYSPHTFPAGDNYIPVTDLTGLSLEEKVMKFSKIDSFLTFQEAFNIIGKLDTLGITHFRYLGK